MIVLWNRRPVAHLALDGCYASTQQLNRGAYAALLLRTGPASCALFASVLTDFGRRRKMVGESSSLGKGRMTKQRPRESGKLVRVVPVIQTRSRGAWTVTMVSLELWDRRCVANFDVRQIRPVDHADGDLRPSLALDIEDDQGQRYNAQPAGGYGGIRDGFHHHRLIRALTPLPDPTARELRVAARLQLLRHDDAFPPGQVVAWSEKAPRTFAVLLAAT